MTKDKTVLLSTREIRKIILALKYSREENGYDELEELENDLRMVIGESL